VCALATLAVVSSQADARADRNITLHVGDAFVVAGTDLACQTEVGHNVIPGQKLVTCFKLKGNNLKPHSYIAALGANGKVVVAPIKSNGNIGAPVFNHRPIAVGAAAKQLTVHAGDTLLLAGTKVGCSINNDSFGIYPTCFRFTAAGGIPGSYAFAETERFAAVLKFNATGKKTTLIFKRKQ
jgi:hypothetical protein